MSGSALFTGAFCGWCVVDDLAKSTNVYHNAANECGFECGLDMQKLNRLSDRTVKTTFSPGKYHDGGGLYLVVTEGRTGINKSWSLRYSVGNGKHRYCGLGAFPLTSLAEARRKAADARRLLADGVDPILHKHDQRAALSQQQATKARTFAECAAAYIAGHEGGWRSGRHHRQWVRTLEMYAYPVVGDLPVADVTREHVLKILQPIWQTKTETAATLRGRIELVLSWAAYMGYREGANPAVWRGGLDHALPSKRKVAPVVHRPSLAYAEVPTFIAELRRRDGVAGKCLEFIILTAVRAGEAIGAKWREIHLQTRTWVIPRERTKTFKEHRVALSSAAVALLEQLPRTGEYVFIGYHGRVLSVASLRALLLRMGFAHQFCTHGFRASFSSWAREMTSHPREIVESALAHSVGDVVERSYARSDALERRRLLMEQWAVHCTAEPAAKVVQLRA